MENKPKISFIGATYQGEQYIVETIKSLQEQTIADVEIIFVIDGSTDDTEDILKALAEHDDRIKYKVLKENVGISIARNIGLKLSTADIICITDDDDPSTPERAEITYKYLKDKTNGVFYGGAYRTDQYLAIVDDYFPNGEYAGYKPAIPWKKGELFKDNNQYIAHGTMGVTRDLMEKVPYREHLKVGIDYPFLKDLETAGADFYWEDVGIQIWRICPDSVTNTRIEEIKLSNKD